MGAISKSKPIFLIFIADVCMSTGALLLPGTIISVNRRYVYIRAIFKFRITTITNFMIGYVKISVKH